MRDLERVPRYFGDLRPKSCRAPVAGGKWRPDPFATLLLEHEKPATLNPTTLKPEPQSPLQALNPKPEPLKPKTPKALNPKPEPPKKSETPRKLSFLCLEPQGSKGPKSQVRGFRIVVM